LPRKQKNDQTRLDVTTKHRRFPYAAIVAAVWLAALAPPVYAEPSGEIQIFVENDFLAGTDRYYSNGLKIGFGAPTDAWSASVRKGLDSVLTWLDLKRDEHYELGFFLGQSIYTPRDIRTSEAQPNDRPWAGWLYAGWALQHQTLEPRPVLDTLELNIGVIGPPALAKPVQTEWHKLIGAPEPRGWTHQLPTEPGFMLGYLKKVKFGNGSVDVIPHAGATVGTVMTFARAGGIVRLGKNLSGFGPDSVEAGGAMLQSTHRQIQKRPGCEYYLFVGLDVRAVGYNAFLDGNFFRSSPGVDRKPVVYDVLSGLSLRYKTARVSLTQIRRSEEFSANGIGSGRQTFHSLNLGMEF
jgi:hypothetical protein